MTVASYTIGEAAKAAVTPRAVRFYESRGLFDAPERTRSGYRLFTDDDVEVLAFIRRGRSLGLSLDAIAEIIQISERGAPCERTDALLAKRLTEIDAAIADLRRQRAVIDDARRIKVDHSVGSGCAVIEQAISSN
ncbi:MAG: MerR family transcriptional regulator [Acidimicrobiia bacterium]|nr:MerR family transcriptional regulator [Acidimicrobiia bacterium]